MVYFALQIISIFNSKLGLFIRGRTKIHAQISSIQPTDKVIWFHAASLGEFEQARPIIEEVKKTYTHHKILVTFFSPSGYEVRKNYPLADVICYLPFDTKRRVKRFLRKVHPEFVVIVKYEFWPNLLNQLKRNHIPTILISGIFRDNQAFFSSYGKWMQKSLKAFDFFFVQNKKSKHLLNSIEFTNVMISGDTRFDRVVRILKEDNSLNFMDAFKNQNFTIVAGSTWEEDEKLLVTYINNSTEGKFVIAPHNINAKGIQQLVQSIDKRVILYSQMKSEELINADVLVIDTIGLLTKIYAYADAVYVGGGFKTGLHNILEPATFGVPVVIGSEYNKFQEAVDLVNMKGCFSVSNQREFSSIFDRLKNDDDFRNDSGKINSGYIQKNKGATQKIMKYIKQKIKG